MDRSDLEYKRYSKFERDLEYESNNIGYDFQCPESEGGGIKCKNYIICDSILPKWWFDCKGSYLCTNCHMMFGTWGSEEKKHVGRGILEIKQNEECPVCLEIKECVTQPRCEHVTCINCFTRCYFGEYFSENDPDFPYSEEEYKKYTENPNDDKWLNDPLIQEYEYNMSEHEDRLNEKYVQEEYLRCCPVCRK